MKKMMLATVGFWLLLVSIGACAEQGRMGKIAVAAEGDTPAAKVSTQAGFSPFLLVFDKDGSFIEAVKNPAQGGGMAQGGGIAVVDFLAERGVKVIVAERFGDRITEVMKGRGVRPVAFKGNAAEAVKSVLQPK
jgi:predicted Fe-Mo cluster-binding NifX family protein